MTLIIAAGNTEQFIQVSDRRLTSNGKLIEDESNKAIVLTCSNARLSVGFTGLAKAGSFETRKWLSKTLNECAPPDYTAEQLIKRFTVKATSEFAQNPNLKFLSREQKRLSIMFTGYLYHHEPPLGALAIVSNFQNIDNNETLNKSLDSFNCYFREERRPNDGKITLFFTIGTLPPVPKQDIEVLKNLVSNKKPAIGIVNKLVDTIQKLSEHPKAGNTIGKQLNSIIIPSDRTKAVESNYHSEAVKMETFMPDQVMVVSEKLHMNVANIKIEPVDKATTPPMSGPKLKPKQPCWCGSGKRYKYCHGKRPDKNEAFGFEFKPDD